VLNIAVLSWQGVDLFLSDFDNANVDSPRSRENPPTVHVDSGTWAGIDGDTISGSGTTTTLIAVIRSQINLDDDLGIRNDLNVDIRT